MPDQSNKAHRFSYLLQGWVAQRLTPDEVDEFLHGLQEEELRELLGKAMTKDLEQQTYTGLETGEERAKMLEALQQTLHTASAGLTVTHTRKWKILRSGMVAAAAVLIGILVFRYWPEGTHHDKENAAIADIDAPKISHAILTLPDGTKIKLDDVKSTAQVQKYGIRLSRIGDGEVAYTQDGGSAGVLQARVDNPRGSKMMKLKLADGTWVWLNAESSISYPLAFNGDTRKVDITGEVYFEVAKLHGKKFIVTAPQATTEVLGTHFDIRAYEDDGATRVTLLEGAVKVAENNSPDVRKLSPNQQAVVNAGIVINNDVNIEEVMAWKEELLSFNEADIKTIMQEVGRLYNMKVVFQGKVPERKFSGRFSRKTSLSVILSVLQKSGINFKVGNGTITVMP
ncbi:FecR family protein [Chitinophaga sp. Cy-1792]|uniref:FecR family protein n=1 Tax=Chitinophaga sp. Cy-1792 TaxID=2608339 RepID=UPI00141DD537|nr:FecR domain-containing protein [Chitinophaga sp. Cy-1792]NIG56791.1 DUF4974 domain-containing protein [Chitinophaga sp. Cy-1792]